MWLFYFVGILALIAGPILASFFAGQFLLGTASWAKKLFAGRRMARRLIGPSPNQPKALVAGGANTSRLDEALLSKPGFFTDDFGIELHGVSLSCRAHSVVVDHFGTRIGFPWSREDRQRAKSVLKMSVVVDARDILPATLALYAEARSDEVGFGDESLFCAFVDGPLSKEFRPGDQLSVSEGWLVLDSPFAATEKRLPALIDAFARATRRLLDAFEEGRPSLMPLLLDNVQHDEVPRVRARSVDRILQLVPDGELRETAIVSALADESAEVRLAAARHLGERGFETAVAIVRNEEIDGSLCQRALRFLLRRFEEQRVVPVLREVLKSDNSRLVDLAVRRLGEIRHRPAVPWLCDLAESAPAETAVILAGALGTIGDEEAELTLIALYERHFDDVKVAAADALGSVGTAAAVSHLLPAADSTRVSQALRVAASTAVKQIQSRLRGHAGSLSVLETAESAGHVSMAPASRGALSDPTADKRDPIELSE